MARGRRLGGWSRGDRLIDRGTTAVGGFVRSLGWTPQRGVTGSLRRCESTASLLRDPRVVSIGPWPPFPIRRTMRVTASWRRRHERTPKRGSRDGSPGVSAPATVVVTAFLLTMVFPALPIDREVAKRGVNTVDRWDLDLGRRSRWTRHQMDGQQDDCARSGALRCRSPRRRLEQRLRRGRPTGAGEVGLLTRRGRRSRRGSRARSPRRSRARRRDRAPVRSRPGPAGRRCASARRRWSRRGSPRRRS